MDRLPFFGLLHLWVTGSISVLRGGWRSNHRCVPYRTASHHQTLGGQALVDRLKDARRQLMLCKHPLSTVIDSLMFNDSPSVLV